MLLTNNFLSLPENKISIKDFLSLTKSEADCMKVIETTAISEVRVSKSKDLTRFIIDSLLAILDDSPKTLESVDAIIVVSQTYNQRIPSVSTQIQNLLECAPDTFCIDINDGCAGLIKAIALSGMLLKQGKTKILVIAGDLNSSITEESEPATRVLFGDGISIQTFEASTDTYDYVLFNNGAKSNFINCDTHHPVMNMNGFEVFRFTRNVVPQIVRDYFSKKLYPLDFFDFIAFHQASALIVNTLSKRLGLSNLNSPNFNCFECGNLGAGSIGAWIANDKTIPLDTSRRLLAIGYGAGLSWGLADIVIQLIRNEILYVTS
jgi:3-oxoacyl-[acyl-carrier-protein] synthase III